MDALQGRRKRRNTVTDSPPLKRRRTTLISERSPLEALPLDLMVKVFCGVEYRDLKQLFHVSKAIRVATLIAKESHFERTPEKKTRDASEFSELEAPNAPLRKSSKSRLKDGEFTDISLSSFPSLDEEQ